jgi:hypothetical protein
LWRRWSLSGREGFGESEVGFRRFRRDETLIFHCAEGWKRRWSRGSVSHSSNVGLGSVGRWHQRLVAYPRSRTTEKEASDVVVLKRQTPSISVCWTRRQQLRWPRRQQTQCTSVAFTTDMSGEKSARVGAYWTAYVEHRTCGPSSDRRVYWLEIDRWKFDSIGHVAFIKATNAVCSIYCKRDRCVWWPRPVYNGSIRRGTSIYMWWPALGPYSWHFDILASILR